MYWTELNTGKHSGLTLPQVIFHDPDWFFHAYEEGYFEGQYGVEAKEVYRRARSVKTPQVFGRKKLVRYIGRGRKGKFGTVGVADEDAAKGKSDYYDVIDFYAPRSFGKYDKTGYKKFLASAKDILFGNPSRRMNREACEAFFNNDYNFDLRRMTGGKTKALKEDA